MDKLTESELVSGIAARGYEDWVFRQCSICGELLYFHFAKDGGIFRQLSCMCGGERPAEECPVWEFLDLFNRQDADLRGRMWAGFRDGKEMAVF